MFAGTGLSAERQRVLRWMCVLIAANQLGFGAIVPVLPLYAKDFGVSKAAVGLSIAIYGLARFLVNVPAGELAERRGRRWTLALGGVVTVVGNLLCAVAPSYPAFLMARFVGGAGAAMVLTGGQVVLSDISEPHNRGRVMALYQGVFLFAVGAGSFPGGLLATHFGLAAPFLANASLAGVVAALAWLRVPETRPPPEPRTGPVTERQSIGHYVRLIRAIPGFALISGLSFAVFFARTGALFNVVPLLAKDDLHLSPAEIGLGLSMISLVGLVLAYPSGVLVDRYGRKSVIVPATFLTAAAMLLFAVVPDRAWFLMACFLWATATGVSGSAPAAYAADMAPPHLVARTLGAYRMIADAGYVVGPLLLGAIADLVSPNAALVAVSLLLVVMGLAFARRAPESRPGSFAPVNPETIPVHR
jgi:DHA1 family multidrug resistance protein-like MFS transporter